MLSTRVNTIQNLLTFVTLLIQLHYVHVMIKLSMCSTLCEKCPNTEFSLIHIFPYPDLTRRFPEKILAFSPNTGKYRSENTWYLGTFQAITIFSLRKNEIKFSLISSDSCSVEAEDTPGAEKLQD